MMSAHDDEISVAFSCPQITPKVYVAKGPSGWPETFQRTKVDSELAKFIEPVTPAELVELFVLQRETSDKKTPLDWHTIVGYLARTMGTSPKRVPSNVGVAFWAAIVIYVRTQRTN